MSAADTDTSDKNRLKPDRLATVLADICAQAGLDPAGAELIKFTNNAVFRLVRDPVVVRIAGSNAVRARVSKIVAAARWLAEHDMPSVRLLLGVEQPVRAQGHLATVWQQVPVVGPSPTGHDLAAILRRFHALPPPNFDLPLWRPVGPIRERIAEATSLFDNDLAFLVATCDETEAALAALRYALPPGPIHGDGFLGNLISGPVRPVICDFDSTSIGPREWDLTPAAVGKLRFNYTTDTHGQLASAYGFDVTQWDGFPVMRRLRELQLVTSVLPVLDSNPGLREQWERRFRSFRDGDEGVRWETYR
jgi:aminoglycoside phosphotransferase (APT) family kinase protein